MNHLSFSSVKDFASCQAMWLAKHIMNKRTPSGDAASWGLAFEAYVLKKLGLVAQPRPDGKVNETVELTGDAALEIERAFEVYASMEGSACHKNAPQQSWIAQEPIEIAPSLWGTLSDEFGSNGDIHLPFIGYIDLFQPSLPIREIRDLKTTTKAGFQAEWAIQTLLYALAKRAQRCTIDVLLRPQKSRAKNPRPPVYHAVQYSWNVTDELLRWAMSWVGIHARQMRTAQEGTINKVSRTGGFWCEWCPLSQECQVPLIAGMTPVNSTKQKGEEE